MNDPLRLRSMLALAFILARYVPIPFLDDYVRERIARVVVARSAGAEALTPPEVVRLGAASDGCLGCLGALFWAPLRLFFFPIAVLLSIRFASRDLIEVFALGRTIERVLADGRYPLAASEEERLAYARDVRIAFDRARRGLDLDAVRGVLSVALGPIRKVVPAAAGAMRRVWHGAATTTETDAEAKRLTAALDDPRMQALLATIDLRFDDALLAQRAQSRIG